MNENELNWDDPTIKELSLLQKYAYVSNIAIEKQFVGFCYRDYPEFKIDSGWRFLYGDESEEFLDNPNNCTSMYLHEVIEWIPQLAHIVEQKVGVEYEWNSNEKAFNPL